MKKFYLSLIALMAFTFNAMAQTELWNSNFTVESWFGDASWGTETESTATLDNGVVTVKIAQDKDSQWKAQVKLGTGLTQLDATKQYDFTCKAVANKAVGGVTFKMMDNVEMKFENQSIKLAEGENTISEKNIEGKVDVSNGVIVFDFGYASAGTEITLSDFSLVEHDPVAAEVVTPWDATASNNLWPANLTPRSYWYAPGWAQIADPEMTVNGDRSFTLSFPTATTDQWQAQVHILSGIQTSADVNYDFQVVLNSTTDIAGATIKFVKVDDDGTYYCTDRHKLTAGEDFVYQLENVAGIDMGELKLVLDFGGCPDNTVVTVKDIVVREHSDFTAEATEYGLVGDFNGWSGDENGVVFYTTEDANVLKATADSFTTGTWGFKVRKGTGWDNLYGRTDAMSTGEAAEIVAGGDNIYIGQANNNVTLTNAVFTLGLDADGNATTLTVTADQNINTADFVDAYMMVGAFNGWSFENSPLKFTYDSTNKNYTASIDQIQGEFKIVKNNSWDGALAGVTNITAGNTYNLVAGGNNASFAATINNAKFTLTIAADGNATLAVEGENAETETTYGLVGEFNNWNNNDEDNLMTKQEDGSYTIHVTDFPCGKMWKVSHNKSWSCFLGDGNDNTVTVGTPYTCAYGDNGNNLTINGDGTFTGTITLSDIVAETSATITLTADAPKYTLNFSAEYDENCDVWGVYADGEPLEYPYDNDNPYTFVEGTQISVGGMCVDASILHEMVVTVNGEEVPADAFDPDTKVYTFTLTQDTEIKIVFNEPAPTLVWTKQAAYTDVPESWGEGYGTIYTDDEITKNMLVTVEKWSDNRLVIRNWFNGTDSYYEGYTDVEITYTDDDYYTVSKVSGSACQGNYYDDSDNYFWTGTTNVSGTYVNLDYVYVYPSDETGYIYMYHDPYTYADYLGWSAYYITWDPAVVSVATGINNVNAADNNAPVYNIAGQRVNNNAKGIVIKNGKKYLNK